MNIHLLLSIILKSYFLTAIVHESPPCSKIKGRTVTKYFIVIHHKTVKVHNLEKKNRNKHRNKPDKIAGYV